MKETGISWMLEVPEHWGIRRFKNVCLLQRGHDLPKEKFKEGEFPVYGSNGIIGYHKEFTTKSPCITIGRSGSVGEINFVEKDFWAHNTCLFVKENYNNDWEYLYFLISSIDIKMVSNGSAVPTLDRNNVHSLKVSYPPTIEEQKQIVEHIKTETRTLDIAISKAEREIELIKEYREAMIAEAVTGKMKL
jgi:type I restriction enzyme S subunit